MHKSLLQYYINIPNQQHTYYNNKYKYILIVD